MKNLLITRLEESRKFQELVQEIEMKKTPINISGLVFVGKSHIISTISENIKRPICVITYNEIQAKNLVKDLKYFTDKVEYFGKREIASYDYISESKDLPYARIEVLNKIYSKQVKIVVTTVEAIMQSMLPKDILYKNVLTFSVGNLFECTGFAGKKNLNNLKQLLLLLGYERNDMVENRGQFSIRGGIVDIGLSEKNGVRIEFWGDEVDSIRYFSIASQRTTEMTDKISIFPAHEYILEYDLEDKELPEYSSIVLPVINNIKENCLNKSEDDKSISNIQSDIEAIQNGEYISKIDKYFNEFYSKRGNFLEYLSKNTLVFVDENLKVNQRIESILIENNNLIKSLIERKRFIPEGIENVSDFNKDEWNNLYNDKQTIYLEENNSSNVNKFEFKYREINFFKGEIEILLSDIKKYVNDKKQVIILAGNKENAEKINKLFEENNIKTDYTYGKFNEISNDVSYIENNEKIDNNVPEYAINPTQDSSIKPINKSKVCPQNDKVVVLRPVPATTTGFECYDLNLVVICMSEAFEGSTKKKKTSSTFRQGEKIVFADLKTGDFVVHKTHGIGEFIGVNTIEADGVTKDYIKIKYRNDDMLYVPTNNLDNVRKYIGGGDTSPRLNKLGSKEWSNTKSKVKKNLREVAKDLIELYAKRQKIKGYAFSKDTDWQRQFEDEFPYQETDDQLRCIDEVKKDMELPRPMDRLLCGDVGYGKTEVAIRAAFKAVLDHKQVAYLVPTTVLASQQYEGFKKRMENFAINVELLNRFRTKKEQNEVVKKLKLGEIDVVIRNT